VCALLKAVVMWAGSMHRCQLPVSRTRGSAATARKFTTSLQPQEYARGYGHGILDRVSVSRCAPGAALPPELAERQADAERDDEREDKPQHECTRLRDGLRISVVRRRV
jgi:hypothetical protein